MSARVSHRGPESVPQPPPHKFDALFAAAFVFLFMSTASSARAALELRDYPVKASGENRAVSLTVPHFQLTTHLGSHFAGAGSVYAVLSAEWRSTKPAPKGENSIYVPVPPQHLFLLVNGDRRAPLDFDSKQILIDSKDPAFKPIPLGDVNIPAAQNSVVAGDYVFQIPADGVEALDLVYVSADGSIRIPLQRGASEAIPKPIAAPVTLGDLEISLLGARQATTVGSQQSPRGQDYFIAEVLLSNRNPAKPVSLWDGTFTLRDAQGNEYRGLDLRPLRNRLNGLSELPAGIPLRGEYAFNVPSAHYALSLTMRGNDGATVQIPIAQSGPPAPPENNPLFTLKTDDGLTIRALDSSRATTIGTLLPESTKKFVIVELSASSDSDKDLHLKPEDFALAYGDTSIAPNNAAAYALPAMLSGDTRLPPHGKLYFGLAFQVPPDAKDPVLQYKEADGIALQHPLPQAQPPQPGAAAAIPTGTDLASPDLGGEIESMSGTFGPGYTGRNLLVANAPAWTPENGVVFPYDVVVSFYKRSAALVSSVVATLSDDASAAPKEVEVWTSTSGPDGGFTRVAAATIDPKFRDQVISFPPVMARFVRFRIVSGYSSFALGLSKLKVIEGSQSGYTPLLKQYPQIADWKYTPRRAAQLGIEFLQPFTAQWQFDHQCYGCHIQSQTLMGLAIATRNNYVVSDDLIRATVDYLHDKQAPEGFVTDAERQAGTEFAAMALAFVEGDEAKTADPHLLRAADWLIAQQAPSGELPMDRVAPPICQGTIVSTANAVTAFSRAYRQSQVEKYRDAADRGVGFIAGAKPVTTQDETFTILTLSRYGKSEQRAIVDKLLARLKSEQLADGGWRESPQTSGSNAFATGQVLYAFKVAGVAVDSPEFKRGVVYLVNTQEPNGSWPSENTQSGSKTVDAPTMWAVIGLAGSFDGKVAEPKVHRDENQAECEKVRKLAALLDKDGKIILHINFDFDKASLRPDALPTIDQIATLLKSYPSLRLEVDGHTDNIGTASRNQALSKERAQTVVQALVARGIDRNRLAAEGFGMSRPIATNRTPEGRFQNRRVELIRKSSTASIAETGSSLGGVAGCAPGQAAAPTPTPAAQVASAAPQPVVPPPHAAAKAQAPAAAPYRAAPPVASAVAPHKPAAPPPAPEVEAVDARLQLLSDAWVLSAPSESGKHVERVHAEKYVLVTGSTPDYLRVRLKSGEVGYVASSAVRLIEPADTVFDVTHDSPVYEKPNRQSKRVAQVHAAGKVRVIGHALKYTQVRMHNGVEGFVPDGAFN
jgi:outer membrane protein OmpA-like peptidoglycan-associated protein